MPTGIYIRTKNMNIGKNPNSRNGFKKGHINVGKPPTGKHWKLSDKNKENISLSKMGEKNPMYGKKGKLHHRWKDDITLENNRIRTSLEIKLWKKANMERDNFICQRCLIRGGKLQVHHINNFADFKELRTAISNGITFCRNCHREFHKKYGVKNNSREQLNEFINIKLWQNNIL